jgi:acetate kinase
MSPAEHVILCINSGSSSLKFALYSLGELGETKIAQGAVEGIGLPAGHLWIWDKNNNVLADIRRAFPEHVAAAEAVSEAAKNSGFPRPAAAGHRVVHGGPHHSTAERVNASLLRELRELIPFAPLHLPSAIQGIDALGARFPGLPQVACFDTAFHRRMPEVAQRLPLSHDLWDEGVRRYGFHGLSYEYIVFTLGARAQGRLVIAHLGNGASLAAVLDGRPLDTTMSFTPTGGLMMGTRSGDLDPGVLLHLMREKSFDHDQLDHAVNEQAGLLGVSGISSDMKILLDQKEREPRAAQAVELFCYQLRKHIGAMTAVLGGLDTLVFTGGIGEHAAPVRWDVCRELAYLGIRLDAERNAAHAEIISAPESTCTVRVIPTNEDLMIARQTRALLFSMPAPALVNEPTMMQGET